jgi:hypothetical protein
MEKTTPASVTAAATRRVQRRHADPVKKVCDLLALNCALQLITICILLLR